MGYTHYWGVHNFQFTSEEFLQLGTIVKALIKTAATKPWEIAVDKKTTAISEVEICFNGPIRTELYHEDFYITKYPDRVNYCKTAYKPYDTIVTAALLAATIISKGKIDISSDGSQEGWVKGFKLLTTAVPSLVIPPDMMLSNEPLTFGFSQLELETVKYTLHNMDTLTATPESFKTANFLDSIPSRILFIGGYSGSGKSSALGLLEARGIPCFSTSRILHHLVNTIGTIRTLKWNEDSPDRERCITLAEAVLVPLLGREVFANAVMKQVQGSTARTVVIETVGGEEYKLFKSLTKAHRCTSINLRRDSESPGIDLRKLLPRATNVSNNESLQELDSKLELILAGIREPR